MQSDLLSELNKVITDVSILAQGFQVLEGFEFTSIRHPANMYNSIVVRNPSSAKRFGGRAGTCEHSLNEYVAFVNENRIDSAQIIAEDIHFLKECPTLKHVDIIPAITSGNNFDFSTLYELDEIRSLFCATSYGKFEENFSEVDYSKIHGLEYLSVSTKYDLNFQNIQGIRTLKVSQNCCSCLDTLFSSRELDTLELVSCGIRSLDGIGNAPKMQCLYLYGNRSLRDISALDSVHETLRALRIQKCPKLYDFSVLERLKNLEYLFLEGNNHLPNLEFIQKLPKLKTLVFDMEIADGNLLPCLNLSYAHCGKMRRHYNVKAAELPKGKYYRGNDDIDVWRRIW